MYQREFRVSACCKIYKRKLWDGIEFPKGMYYEDICTTFKLILRSTKIAWTNEILYGYRLRPGSIMKSRFSPKMMSIIAATRIMFDGVTGEYPDLRQAASSRAFSGNRCVYLSLPFTKRSERMQIWTEMKKYRWTIITDHEARKRERVAALLSYMGADLFHLLLSWLYRRQQMTK